MSRLESTEQRQQQMMAFLAKAVQNPAFLQELLNQRQAQRISGPDKSEFLKATDSSNRLAPVVVLQQGLSAMFTCSHTGDIAYSGCILGVHGPLQDGMIVPW